MSTVVYGLPTRVLRLVLVVGLAAAALCVAVPSSAHADEVEHWCDAYQGGITFPDSRGSGHAFFIDCLAEATVVEGMADGLFHPRRDVSREQLASFLVRMIELELDEVIQVGDPVFSDVSPGSTHGRAVYKLRHAGIIQGYPDGTFRPTDPVTRDQTARYIVNAIEWLNFDLPASGASFPDTRSSQYALDIDKLATAGAIRGFTDGTFRPRTPVTRGQMARFIGDAWEATW